MGCVAGQASCPHRSCEEQQRGDGLRWEGLTLRVLIAPSRSSNTGESGDADRLAAELDAAGVRRTRRQVKIDGVNLSGWLRADLDAAADAYVSLDG